MSAMSESSAVYPDEDPSGFTESDRLYNLAKAHSNPAAFMAIRAAHYMGIDWRHVSTMEIVLDGREGRTVGERPEDDVVFDHANECAKLIRARCQSPIEELFVATVCLVPQKARPRMNLALRERMESKIFWWEMASGKHLATLHQQFQVGRYRCDFVIEGPSKTVVVELDGHDFHERTKAQAARDKSRDRALVETGYTVVRFTGSEIWKDPAKCTDQAMRIAGLG